MKTETFFLLVKFTDILSVISANFAYFLLIIGIIGFFAQNGLKLYVFVESAH